MYYFESAKKEGNREESRGKGCHIFSEEGKKTGKEATLNRESEGKSPNIFPGQDMSGKGARNMFWEGIGKRFKLGHTLHTFKQREGGE